MCSFTPIALWAWTCPWGRTVLLVLTDRQRSNPKLPLLTMPHLKAPDVSCQRQSHGDCLVECKCGVFGAPEPFRKIHCQVPTAAASVAILPIQVSRLLWQ